MHKYFKNELLLMVIAIGAGFAAYSQQGTIAILGWITIGILICIVFMNIREAIKIFASPTPEVWVPIYDLQGLYSRLIAAMKPSQTSDSYPFEIVGLQLITTFPLEDEEAETPNIRFKGQEKNSLTLDLMEKDESKKVYSVYIYQPVGYDGSYFVSINEKYTARIIETHDEFFFANLGEDGLEVPVGPNGVSTIPLPAEDIPDVSSPSFT